MGGKTSRNSSPARREASTPRPPGVGPLGEEAGSLRGLHSPVVDSSWFSGSLETTLKLSKQIPISQFFWPMYNLSPGLLYCRQGRVERCRSFSQLWCSLSSQEQQGPWHSLRGEGSSSPMSQHRTDTLTPPCKSPSSASRTDRDKHPGREMTDGGTVSDGPEWGRWRPALTSMSKVLTWTEKLCRSWTLVCTCEHHQYPQSSPPLLVSPHPINVLSFPSRLASLLAAPRLSCMKTTLHLQDTSPAFPPAALPFRAMR